MGKNVERTTTHRNHQRKYRKRENASRRQSANWICSFSISLFESTTYIRNEWTIRFLLPRGINTTVCVPSRRCWVEMRMQMCELRDDVIANTIKTNERQRKNIIYDVAMLTIVVVFVDDDRKKEINYQWRQRIRCFLFTSVAFSLRKGMYSTNKLNNFDNIKLKINENWLLGRREMSFCHNFHVACSFYVHVLHVNDIHAHDECSRMCEIRLVCDLHETG